MTDAKTNWPLIGLLWATGLMAAAQFAKITLTLDALAVVYPAAPVPLAVSAVSVMGILCGALSGFFVARIGVRRAVLGAVALSGCMSLLQGVAMPFGAFIAVRVVEGLGHLLLVVALPTLMAAVARPHDKSVVMGIWATFFGVGFALLALVVPVLVEQGGLRAVYVAHGLMLWGLWPVLWWALPRIMVPRGQMPNVFDIHATIYTRSRYFAAALGHGIYASLFIALIAFLPAALGAPWLTAVVPLVNLSGTFLSGFIARVIPASRLSIIGFVSAGSLFALMGATGSIAVALCALFATGITAGANFAAVPELNTAPADQARANGALAQIGNMGTFSGTPIFALVAGSLWGIAGVSVLICVLGAVLGGLAYGRARMSPEVS